MYTNSKQNLDKRGLQGQTSSKEMSKKRGFGMISGMDKKQVGAIESGLSS